MVSSTLRAVHRGLLVAPAAGDDRAVGAAVVGLRAVGAGERGVQRGLQSEQSVTVPARWRRRCSRRAIRRDTRGCPGVRARPPGTCRVICARDVAGRRCGRGRRTSRCCAASSSSSFSGAALPSLSWISFAISLRAAGPDRVRLSLLALRLGEFAHAPGRAGTSAPSPRSVNASGLPLRSVIEPRIAGSTTVVVRCSAACADSRGAVDALDPEQLRRGDRQGRPA